MISKAKVKYIKSLQIKKFRNIHREFLVEGAKSVLELLNSDFEISSLFLTKDFAEMNKVVLKSRGLNFEEASSEELEKSGTFSSNNAGLAIVKMKENKPLYITGSEYILLLDEIKDPGNLGTVIRLADWYGIKKIICSDETAEYYNPKVISSTMGSFTRVNLYYCDLKNYLREINSDKIYAAVLDGKNIRSVNFDKKGYVLLGNESSGIHDELIPFVKEKISIPRIGKAESLNVGVAAGIILDNILNH